MTHTTRVDEFVARAADQISRHAERELEALVAVSSPSGDVGGAEEAIAVCSALLPPDATPRARDELDPSGRARPDRPDRRLGPARLLLLGHLNR